MKKRIMVLVMIFPVMIAGVCGADDADLRKELDAIKQRVQELEAKLKTQEAKQIAEASRVEPTDGAPMHSGEQSAVAERLKERLGTLSIHGGVVGFYQGRNGVDSNDMDFKDANGAGFAVDLELGVKPIENGAFFMRLHAGEGQGADKDLDDNGGLFANLNTIADDNPGDEGVSLLEAYYTQTFLDERLFLSMGKTEQFVFIDDNAFANHEYTQFIGKPFVNDTVLDGEDEYTPLLAVGGSPMERLKLVFLFQSSSRPYLEEDLQKSKYDDIFDTPFLAGQMTYSPEIYGLPGNYRLYVWGATYQRPEIGDEEGADRGWGVGLSLDQKVHEKVGLFARLGYHNDSVYEVPWSWSAGANIVGVIPARSEDEVGLGVAGLVANHDLENDGVEYHFEAYYRIVLSEYFSISPDLQYVVNPLGDSDNDDIVAGMLRGQLSF